SWNPQQFAIPIPHFGRICSLSGASSAFVSCSKKKKRREDLKRAASIPGEEGGLSPMDPERRVWLRTPRASSPHHAQTHPLDLRRRRQTPVPQRPHHPIQALTDFLRQAYQRLDYPTQRRFDIPLPEHVHHIQRQHEVDDRPRVVLEAIVLDIP